MLVLLAVLVVVVGFAVRLNPLLVVVAAALAAGVLAAAGPGATVQGLGQALVHTIETLGREFTRDRYVSVIWLILPVIGLLEREGLQVRARRLVGRIRAATVGRLLISYFVLRQATAALGLNAMMGHAQTVRPLLAPMAEGAMEARAGPLTDRVRFRLRAWAAATDNVAVFFGEDIFVAMSSILLITGALQGMGVKVQPIQLSLWAIPTAVCALVVHGWRLLRLDGRLERELKAEREAGQ
jgi:uncharacterized membrane protein